MNTSLMTLVRRACTAAMMMVMPPIHMATVLMMFCSMPPSTPASIKPPPMSMNSLMRPRMALLSSTDEM